MISRAATVKMIAVGQGQRGPPELGFTHKGYTMAETTEGTEWSRCVLRLSDAMAEALGETSEEPESDGVVVPRVYATVRTRSGITFRRCGGGYQVIRRGTKRD